MPQECDEQEPQPELEEEDEELLVPCPTSGVEPEERIYIFQMRETSAELQSGQFVSQGSFIDLSTVKAVRQLWQR